MQIESSQSQQRFMECHRCFFEGSGILEEALQLAFHRHFKSDDIAALMVFFIGKRCEEDFREIALLASNGYGWGATSHLRGMYERAVVVAYLHTNPGSVVDFVDYDLVRRWKAAQAIKQTFGVDAEKDAKLAELKIDFERVRPRFMVRDCKKCGTERLNHTWSQLDFVTMASKVGSLGKAIVPAYYIPLAQAHCTFASATDRLSERDGKFFVDPQTSETKASRSFQWAHLIMLSVLTVQHEHFTLPDFGASLEKAYKHYHDSWLSDAHQ